MPEFIAVASKMSPQMEESENSPGHRGQKTGTLLHCTALPQEPRTPHVHHKRSLTLLLCTLIYRGTLLPTLPGCGQHLEQSKFHFFRVRLRLFEYLPSFSYSTNLSLKIIYLH